MCSPLAAVAGLQLLGSMKAGQAEGDAADFSAAILERNAMMSEAAASDAIARGGVEAGKVRSATSRLIGKQRAAYGASGVSVDSGSALDVYASTRGAGEQDADTVANNAAREAWGLKVTAGNQRAQAQLARMQGANARQAGLITGFTKAASMFLPR